MSNAPVATLVGKRSSESRGGIALLGSGADEDAEAEGITVTTTDGEGDAEGATAAVVPPSVSDGELGPG